MTLTFIIPEAVAVLPQLLAFTSANSTKDYRN
jgi:hypothetical protein